MWKPSKIGRFIFLKVAFFGRGSGSFVCLFGSFGAHELDNMNKRSKAGENQI